jgi:uncharacterized protein with HEPN domain
MPLDRVDDRLRGMLERIERIRRAVAGIDYVTFIESETTYDAVERNIEVIGDPVRKLPAELLAQVREMPWAQVAGMRNVLAHDYDGMIDTEIVWDVATRRLSELETAVRRLLDIWTNRDSE